jgi:hypothetical protein
VDAFLSDLIDVPLAELSIGESLSIVELPLIESVECVRRQGRVLSLIAHGEDRPLYLLSMPMSWRHADWSVLGIFRSGVGNQIRDSLDWANAQMEEMVTVELLRVPEWNLSALYLVEPEEVIVAAAPQELSRCEKRKMYKIGEFVEIVRSVALKSGVLAEPRRRVSYR